MKNTRSTEITDVLKPEAVEKLQVGQILMFMKKGQRIDLKITKKADGRIWAKKVTTYARDEVAVNMKDQDGKEGHETN